MWPAPPPDLSDTTYWPNLHPAIAWRLDADLRHLMSVQCAHATKNGL